MSVGRYSKSPAPLSPSPLWFPGKLGLDSRPASHMDLQMAQDGCAVNFQALLRSLRSRPSLALGEDLGRAPIWPARQNTCYGGTCKALVEW